MIKKGFTLIEILVVVVAIGIMMTMIPFRLQSLQSHAKLSLISQQRDDVRQRTITRMRQGRVYSSATIILTASGTQVLFTSGALESTGQAEAFDIDISLDPATGLQRQMDSYAIGCSGYASGFKMAYDKMQVCYMVDTNSCNMQRVNCQ